MSIYTVGLRNVGSYQVSGHPYLSGAITPASIGSASVFQFPNVSKRITISNEDEDYKAMVCFVPYTAGQATARGFTNSASSSGNWLYLPSSSSIELDVKCTEVYVASYTGDAVDFVTVYAELTNIPISRMYSFDGEEGIST